MTNKNLIMKLEGLSLQLYTAQKIFQGIENAKLKKKIFSLIDQYNLAIKHYPSNKKWEEDKGLNKLLQTSYDKVISLLHKAYDNLFDYFQEEGLDDSDSSGAATAAFLFDGIDPLRMEVRVKKNNPQKKSNPIVSGIDTYYEISTHSPDSFQKIVISNKNEAMEAAKRLEFFLRKQGTKLIVYLWKVSRFYELNDGELYNESYEREEVDF